MEFPFRKKKIELKTEKLTVTKPPPALSHKTLAVSLAKRAKKDVIKMTEDFKLKRQAKSIRHLIVTLENLIDSTEMPIKLKVEIIEGHKNLNTVWKEIGVIPLNQ